MSCVSYFGDKFLVSKFSSKVFFPPFRGFLFFSLVYSFPSSAKVFEVRETQLNKTSKAFEVRENQLFC